MFTVIIMYSIVFCYIQYFWIGTWANWSFWVSQLAQNTSWAYCTALQESHLQIRSWMATNVHCMLSFCNTDPPEMKPHWILKRSCVTTDMASLQSSDWNLCSTNLANGILWSFIQECLIHSLDSAFSLSRWSWIFDLANSHNDSGTPTYTSRSISSIVAFPFLMAAKMAASLEGPRLPMCGLNTYGNYLSILCL